MMIPGTFSPTTQCGRSSRITRSISGGAMRHDCGDERKTAGEKHASWGADTDSEWVMADTAGERVQGHAALRPTVETDRPRQVQPDAGNSTGEVIHHAMCGGQPGQHGRWESQEFADGRCWAIEPGMGRVVNGLPNRVDRLKCLGNAVVPQQAYPIFKALKEELT